MLKIRDDVDLEILTKYGFNKNFYSSGSVYRYIVKHGTEAQSILIGQDRIIHYNIFSVINTLDDVIYDLINDDLIEKI